MPAGSQKKETGEIDDGKGKRTKTLSARDESMTERVEDHD